MSIAIDNNGNATSSASIVSKYDFENRMTVHGGVTLVYDGDGIRVSETVGGTTTKSLVDTLNPTKLYENIISSEVRRCLPACL